MQPHSPRTIFVIFPINLPNEIGIATIINDPLKLICDHLQQPSNAPPPTRDIFFRTRFWT